MEKRLERRIDRAGRKILHWFACGVACLMLAACYNMRYQPRYDPLEPSAFFPDGRSARPLPTGVVPQGDGEDESEFARSGKDASGAFVDAFPFPVTKEVLERGRERYNIYCSPCHGEDGYAQGMIVQRGFSPPPSFHQDRLRQAPAGYFFDVITHGFGRMYAYAYRVPVDDRWAIIAYIRALQLSQNAALDQAPPDALSQLGGSSP